MPARRRRWPAGPRRRRGRGPAGTRRRMAGDAAAGLERAGGSRVRGRVSRGEACDARRPHEARARRRRVASSRPRRGRRAIAECRDIERRTRRTRRARAGSSSAAWLSPVAPGASIPVFPNPHRLRRQRSVGAPDSSGRRSSVLLASMRRCPSSSGTRHRRSARPLRSQVALIGVWSHCCVALAGRRGTCPTRWRRPARWPRFTLLGPLLLPGSSGRSRRPESDPDDPAGRVAHAVCARRPGSTRATRRRWSRWPVHRLDGHRGLAPGGDHAKVTTFGVA